MAVVIEMSPPGVGIPGSKENMVREPGRGAVVGYAGQHRPPQWIDPPKAPWDYTIFGTPTSNSPAPQQTIEMVFEKIPRGDGKFNSWLINGKPYPHEHEFMLQQGTRYRLVIRDRDYDA